MIQSFERSQSKFQRSKTHKIAHMKKKECMKNAHTIFRHKSSQGCGFLLKLNMFNSLTLIYYQQEAIVHNRVKHIMLGSCYQVNKARTHMKSYFSISTHTHFFFKKTRRQRKKMPYLCYMNMQAYINKSICKERAQSI